MRVSEKRNFANGGSAIWLDRVTSAFIFLVPPACHVTVLLRGLGQQGRPAHVWGSPDPLNGAAGVGSGSTDRPRFLGLATLCVMCRSALPLSVIPSDHAAHDRCFSRAAHRRHGARPRRRCRGDLRRPALHVCATNALPITEYSST